MGPIGTRMRIGCRQCIARSLTGLWMYHIAGDYLFVHVWLWPGLPLGQQSNGDMMWIP
jgi:hypothetical protein